MTADKMNFLIVEYGKLKDEQSNRIAFRDQMTFVTLGVIGGVFSFVIEKPDYVTALLVLPFICIVLGWTYLTNDAKISEIGRYCRTVLIPKVESLDVDEKLSLLPSWEDFHRRIERRKERKVIQLIIDLGIFCVSAIFSLIVFFFLIECYTTSHVIVAVIEGIFIMYLAYQFFSYSALVEE